MIVIAVRNMYEELRDDVNTEPGSVTLVVYEAIERQ
jgi:hypothetical protein